MLPPLCCCRRAQPVPRKGVLQLAASFLGWRKKQEGGVPAQRFSGSQLKAVISQTNRQTSQATLFAATMTLEIGGITFNSPKPGIFKLFQAFSLIGTVLTLGSHPCSFRGPVGSPHSIPLPGAALPWSLVQHAPSGPTCSLQVCFLLKPEEGVHGWAPQASAAGSPQAKASRCRVSSQAWAGWAGLGWACVLAP